MEISAVVPVYNEVENIPHSFEKIKKALEKGFKEFEIIFVNDGSCDGSYELLEEMKKKESCLKAFHILENSGQTAGIELGFKMAKGDLILVMDGDLQTDPNDLYKMLEYIPKYDFVNGWREKRNDGFKRALASKIGNGFRNFVTGDSIKDTGCPLKLIKKEVAKSYKLFKGMHRFLPTLAKYMGFKVIEIPINHFDRIYGSSKYKVFGRGFSAFFDVLAVRWMKKRILNYRFQER